MTKRTIKEGEPMDPIQVGDIITLELLDGSTISELLAVTSCNYSCKGCALDGENVGCYSDWKVKDSEKYGRDYTTMGLCCTKPVLDSNSTVDPEFCRFIKLDSVLENI